MNRYNGWCHREHIYGILVKVEVEWQERYEVRSLIKDIPHNPVARELCDPDWAALPQYQ